MKSFVRDLHSRYARAFHSFGPAELAASLRSLGLSDGDVVLVHSSFDAFEGFSGGVTDVVAVLQQLVGERGILLMPTIPFTGTAVEWVREHPRVDLRRTPSRMGLITELFRRSEGVVRSVHPTHPIAAWGRGAVDFVAGHQEAATPCGVGSPYHRLLECNGKILLLGADVGSVTFYHTVEELLEESMPASPFTVEQFRVECVATDGTEHVTTTRLFDPLISRRRNLLPLVPEFTRRNSWRRARVGLLPITMIPARAVLEAVSDLAARGKYCYDDYPPHPVR
jgi:aminoglycoside 3-N-acetyltransferase